ncbi:hypothetical protein COB52_02685 [Candidatus Kaiserbacteria bacterium]|nr:MAG: hypothetical protein COB52_02685 [Candidatus Kaiserbacteria bacterium]
MEPDQITPGEQENKSEDMAKDSSLSKYLVVALIGLFSVLSGWIGYTLSPQKVVEGESVVLLKTFLEEAEAEKEQHNYSESTINEVTVDGIKHLWEVSSPYTKVRLFRAVASESEYEYLGKDYEYVLGTKNLPTDAHPMFFPETYNETGNALLISFGCINCDGGGTRVKAVVSSRGLSRNTRSNDLFAFTNIGRAEIFEWTGKNTFRYKQWPDEKINPSFYEGADCGLGGCDPKSVDWTTIKWQLGELYEG